MKTIKLKAIFIWDHWLQTKSDQYPVFDLLFLFSVSLLLSYSPSPFSGSYFSQKALHKTKSSATYFVYVIYSFSLVLISFWHQAFYLSGSFTVLVAELIKFSELTLCSSRQPDLQQFLPLFLYQLRLLPEFLFNEKPSDQIYQFIFHNHFILS